MYLNVPYLGSFVDWLVNRVPPLSYLIVQYAVPIAFGALCGVMCERSGVVNIGIEGMILTAAFVAFLRRRLPATRCVGRRSAAILAIVIRDHRRDAALAAPRLAVDHDQGRPDHQRHGHQHPRPRRDGLLQPAAGLDVRAVRRRARCPVRRPRRGRQTSRSIGPIINGALQPGPDRDEPDRLRDRPADPAVPIALGPADTRPSASIRKAADTVGIDVIRTRYRNVVLGGVFAGLAGAYLTLEQFDSFQDNMTGGRGFIGLAAMIFGRWTPLGAYGAALLFGTVQSMQLAVRISPPAGDLGEFISTIPPQIFGMLPYIFTIIVLAGVVGRAIPPAADGIPTTRRRAADRRRRGRRPAKAERARRPRADARAARPRTRAAGPVPVLDDAGIATCSRPTRRIAVIGASGEPVRGRRSGSCGRSWPGGLRLRPGQPERARGPRACPPSATLAEAVDGDRSVRHRRRLPALRAVRAARPARRSRRARAACGSSSAS